MNRRENTVTLLKKSQKKYKILSSTEKIEDLLSPDNLRENLSKEKAA